MKSVLILALAVASLAAPLAQAADARAGEPSHAGQAAPATDKLGKARTLIAARQWSAAIDELKRVDDKSSADWNNLMGYTMRKGKTPDLTASEQYYDQALRIDPHHRNTLEYSGELSLMKGDLAKAQARLASLNGECGTACSQYSNLKAAIDRYQANGNKYLDQANAW